MKKLLTLIAVAGSLNLCQAQSYTATFTGTQEAPPNGLTGSEGTYAYANFTLSGDTLTVTGGVYANSVGIPTTITINDAPPGFNAMAPLFDLTVDPDAFSVGGGEYDGTFSGSGTLTSTEINDLNSGDLYANIQTTTYASPGEIRGQIGAVPEPVTMTLMGVGSLAWMAMRRKKD
jgi:hypothetical protein